MKIKILITILGLSTLSSLIMAQDSDDIIDICDRGTFGVFLAVETSCPYYCPPPDCHKVSKAALAEIESLQVPYRYSINDPSGRPTTTFEFNEKSFDGLTGLKNLVLNGNPDPKSITEAAMAPLAGTLESLAIRSQRQDSSITKLNKPEFGLNFLK